jgi:metal-sulfur cluster biosynthetic enzyme
MYDSGDSTPHDATTDPMASDPDTFSPSEPDESSTPAAGAADGGSALSVDQVKLALRRVKDPELNLNIIDLGLIYDIRVDGYDVEIDMSLTSPGCPSGPEIMGDAEKQLQGIPGVGVVAVNLVWSPPWTPDRIEPRVRAYMGF